MFVALSPQFLRGDGDGASSRSRRHAQFHPQHRVVRLHQFRGEHAEVTERFHGAFGGPRAHLRVEPRGCFLAPPGFDATRIRANLEVRLRGCTRDDRVDAVGDDGDVDEADQRDDDERDEYACRVW